jgi:hypothetical protein
VYNAGKHRSTTPLSGVRDSDQPVKISLAPQPNGKYRKRLCVNLATGPNLRKIAVLGLLAVVLTSIDFPSFNPNQVLGRSLNLNRARTFNCLDAAIPAHADALFVVNPTNPPDYNVLATYYRTQYFLAPRLVALADTSNLETEMAQYDWLVETSTKGEPLESLNARLQFSKVKDCDDFYVLEKNAEP